MAKRAAVLEIAMPARSAGGTTHRWLYGSLRGAILEGRLRPGTRLPATRDLARQHALARGTVVNAYDQLKSEGYVEGSIGSGTYVSRVLPEQWLQVSSAARVQYADGRRRKPALSEYSQRTQAFPGYEDRPVRAFRANLPALDLFPVDLWAKIANHCLRRAPIRQLMGCDALGYLPLRKAVAEYLTASRGVKCTAEQVAIVSGVQEALDLAARLFVNRGDLVGVENPGYIGAQLVFRAWGARILPIAIDEEGARTSRLPAKGVRLIYVTPGHQFPLGTTMSLARRMELLAWARKSRAVIFEDDYDGEYRYSGRPIPAMQGLGEPGLVLYAGSFSKVLFPALRLGYMLMPADFVERIAALKSLTNRHCPVLEQVVLAEFIAEGHFARHVRRMREVYAERLNVLLEEGRRELRGGLELSEVEAGLQTVGWLHGVTSDAAVRAAHARGVDVTSLASYGGRGLQGLQLGFAAVRPGEIRRGVRELAIALEAARRDPRA
jgi:GntR family transcriptional regulator / MocR family aminotransferase